MPPETHRAGPLIAIGGNEDRTHDRDVLDQTLRAAARSHQAAPRVAVLTAASGEPEQQWQTYDKAFRALGGEPAWLDIRDRAGAADAASLELITRADLLFMTGGDQERLTRLLSGSPAHRLMLRRQREQGLAIAGTSAGASAIGTLMPGCDIAEDTGTVLELSDEDIPQGLGFLRGVVIDQHFSQRRRLARLINLASRQGGLAGMGIDEDTAAIIGPGPTLSVVGSGSVTLVDCRTAQRSRSDQPLLSLRDLRLHRLRAGARLEPHAGGDAAGTPGGRDFSVLLP